MPILTEIVRVGSSNCLRKFSTSSLVEKSSAAMVFLSSLKLLPTASLTELIHISSSLWQLLNDLYAAIRVDEILGTDFYSAGAGIEEFQHILSVVMPPTPMIGISTACAH